MADSPFGGPGAPGPVNYPSSTQPLLDALKNANVKRYIIDPNGAKMEMVLDGNTGTFWLKSGDSVISLSYVRA